MRRAASVLALSLSVVSSTNAQQVTVTADDYARAERFLRDNVASLVSGTAVDPMWLAGERFIYRNRTTNGNEFYLVDPARGTRVRCSPETDR